MDDIRTLILNRVRAIAPVLDEAMAAAMVRAEERAKGFEHGRFPHTRPLTIRQDARLVLEGVPLPDEWQVRGDSRKMGQLVLHDGITGMNLRFLKAPYTQSDRIPHAGHNNARRVAWTQARLHPLLPGFRRSGLAEVPALADETFLLIWAYLDPNRRMDGYDLRIVHPLEPGRFGARTLCDLDLTIPRGGILGEENLRFVGVGDDEDLFGFDLADEDDLTGSE